MPLFGESNLLTVSFAHRSEPAGDAEVALLAGVAEQCYGLNLADSKPTDAGLAPLAGLKNLAELHLEHSAVTDAGLAHIKGLTNLQYVNLFGTGITDAGAAEFQRVEESTKALFMANEGDLRSRDGAGKGHPRADGEPGIRSSRCYEDPANEGA